MNIDNSGNKTRKAVLERRHNSFQRKCGRLSKRAKYWKKENQQRKHSRFQILQKSVCYKVLSTPATHRVLVLKDKNVAEEKPIIPSTCGLCLGKCLCMKIKDKEYESFIFDKLQYLQTENCRLHYMKKCLRPPLYPVDSENMKSDNKIPRVQRTNGFSLTRKDRHSTSVSDNSMFTSKQIDFADMNRKYRIKNKNPLLVDTELERKIEFNKKLLKKPEVDTIGTKNLRAIESACMDTWYSYMPNVQISSKKQNKHIFSDNVSFRKLGLDEWSLFSREKDKIVKEAKTSSSTMKHKAQEVFVTHKPKPFPDKLNASCENICRDIQNRHPINHERSKENSSQLKDPRLDPKRILKRKAQPKEISLKRVKWSKSVAAHSNGVSNDWHSAKLVNPEPKSVYKSHSKPRKLVDPRLKHSKLFPNNLSCPTEQCSSKIQNGKVTCLDLNPNEAHSSSELFIKSSLQVSSKSLTKPTCSISSSCTASKPTLVPSSTPSFKRRASDTSAKCTYSHPILPKTKKQVVPQLQTKYTNSPVSTDFILKPVCALSPVVSVKTSDSLSPETQSNHSNEPLTSSLDASVKTRVHVSSENPVKRTHNRKPDIVPKKKAKYSSNHGLLPLNKCDINISSVQTNTTSVISVKIMDYNTPSTGNEINVEVLSQQLQKGETISTTCGSNDTNSNRTNQLRTKKFPKIQSSCDISKNALSSSSATLISKVQSGDIPSTAKKTIDTVSSSRVSSKRKVSSFEKPTSSLKCSKEFYCEQHNTQACSEVIFNKEDMLEYLSSDVVCEGLCTVANEKHSLPKLKQQKYSNSVSLLLKKYKQMASKRKVKLLNVTFKKQIKSAISQTKSSCVTLSNTMSSSCLPFDFKVERFMQEFLHTPTTPRYKKCKLSTIWLKTLCMPLKFVGRLNYEYYLNYICSDSITKPATAMEIFDSFLQNRLSIHLMKHANMGLIGIMKYFAIRSLKLFKSRRRKLKSNTKKCLDHPTSSTNHILMSKTCHGASKKLPENSLQNQSDNECLKLKTLVNEKEMTDSKNFSISTMWVKKDLEWEVLFQCSNLMIFFELTNLKKEPISLLLLKKGISFHTLDCSSFLEKSEAKKSSAFILQKQLLCNSFSTNHNFPRSVFLGAETIEGQELQYSDFVKEKRHKSSNKVSIYKFLCNNYKIMSFIKHISLDILCLKYNMLLSNCKDFYAMSVVPEKYLTFSKLDNEQVFVMKPELFSSNFCVTYKMCDIFIKKDPKCLMPKITSFKLENDSKCFSQAFTCEMKNGAVFENKAMNPFTNDSYKLEHKLSHNSCINNMKMKTTNFPKSEKFQIKEDETESKVINPSCLLNNANVLTSLQEQPNKDTTDFISRSMLLPISKVTQFNDSEITELSAAIVQISASQEQLCTTFSTTLDDTKVQLPSIKKDLSVALNTTNGQATQSELSSNGFIKVPQKEHQLSNGLSSALNATNIQATQSEVPFYGSVELTKTEEQLSNGFSSSLNATNIQAPQSEVSSNGFTKVPHREQQLSNGLSTALSATDIQATQSEVSSTGFINVPHKEQQLSNGLSKALNATDILATQPEVFSNGFLKVAKAEKQVSSYSSSALNATNVQAAQSEVSSNGFKKVPHKEQQLSNGLSTALNATDIQATQSEVSSNGFLKVAKAEKQVSSYSSSALNATNVQVAQSVVSYNGFVEVTKTKEQLSDGFSSALNGFVEVTKTEEQLSSDSSSALNATKVQAAQSEVSSNGFKKVPHKEQQLSNGLSTALNATDIQATQSEVSSTGFIKVPHKEQQLSNGLSKALNATDIQATQSEVSSNGFLKVAKAEKQVSSDSSSAFIATNVQVAQSEVSYNGFVEVTKTEGQLFISSSSALNTTNIQVAQSKVSYNGFVEVTKTEEQLLGDSSSALNATNVQAAQSEVSSNGFIEVNKTKDQLSNGFSSATNIQAAQSGMFSNGFVEVTKIKEQLSNGLSSALNATHVQEVQSDLSSIGFVPVFHSEEVMFNDFPTTAPKPTSVQLPALKEQSENHRKRKMTKALPPNKRNTLKSTYNNMEKLNDIALAEESQTYENKKNQELLLDLFSRIGVGYDTSNIDIDINVSLKSNTENKILQPCESDSTHNKSLQSPFQEYSVPIFSQSNSGNEVSSICASNLTQSKEVCLQNLDELNCSTNCSSPVTSKLSKASSLNSSQDKIIYPCNTSKTSETLLPSSGSVAAQKNSESLHCSFYVSDVSSSEEATASNIQKRKSPHCSLKVTTESFATSKEVYLPNIAETYSSSEVPKKTLLTSFDQAQGSECCSDESSLNPTVLASFDQAQGSECCSDESSLNPTVEPTKTLLSPICKTKTSLNCDRNSCRGATASEVFRTDCHLKGKTLNASLEILNSAFRDFDLFEEGRPLQQYYQHLTGTDNHFLNLDCIRDNEIELSGEDLESYKFLTGQLDYHRNLLRGLIHFASNPDADCHMQTYRRIALQLEYIEGYELACQALLL